MREPFFPTRPPNLAVPSACLLPGKIDARDGRSGSWIPSLLPVVVSCGRGSSGLYKNNGIEALKRVTGQTRSAWKWWRGSGIPSNDMTRYPSSGHRNDPAVSCSELSRPIILFGKSPLGCHRAMSRLLIHGPHRARRSMKSPSPHLM